MMKILFVTCYKLFSFLRYLHFWLFRKTAYEKAMADFKIYDFTDLTVNNCNTHISQYFKKKGNKTMKFDQLI